MKYIVYKTTNLINNYIYIGIHEVDNPNIFDGYIGDGIYINKPNTYKYSKTNFQIAVNQFGVKNFKRETIATFDTLEEAILTEGLIVNEHFLARLDVYNMTLNEVYSNIKNVKCYLFSPNGVLINVFDNIDRASEVTGKSIYSIYRSIIYRFKLDDCFWLSDLDIFAINDGINVCRYNADTGVFEKEFSSLTEAANDSEISVSEIMGSAKLGYRIKDYQFLFIKSDNYADGKTKYLKTRPVCKYDSDGAFIKEYDTQLQAEFDNKGSNITKSIKTKTPCSNGFLWSLDKLEKYCSKVSKTKKIGQFDSNGNLVATYNSVKECCEKTGVTSQGLTIGKQYKDFTFHAI